jgi:hypothetical protein
LELLDNVVDSRFSLNGTNSLADFDITKRYLATRAIDELMAFLSSTGVLAWYLGYLVGSVRDLANADGTAVLDHIKQPKPVSHGIGFIYTRCLGGLAVAAVPPAA